MRTLISLAFAAIFIFGYRRYMLRLGAWSFSWADWAAKSLQGFAFGGGFYFIQMIILVGMALLTGKVVLTDFTFGMSTRIDFAFARGIFAGVSEEILFTALLFPELARKMRVEYAALACALLFSAAHFALNWQLFNPGAVLYMLVGTFSLSVLSISLFCRTRSIWPSIFLHVTYDTFLGIVVSGCVGNVPTTGVIQAGLIDCTNAYSKLLNSTISLIPHVGIAYFCFMKWVMPVAVKQRTGVEYPSILLNRS